jgi:hypothetical protein
MMVGGNYEEATEGFLTYRIADRGRDHPDHRGNRHPEPAAFKDGR